MEVCIGIGNIKVLVFFNIIERDYSVTFKEYIADETARNVWLNEPKFSVYIRRSMRYINGEKIPCLDLGSIEVDEEERGKGVLKAFLLKMENAAKQMNRAVFVESVLEPRLIPFLLNRGYLKYPDSSEITPSFYRIL